MAIVFKKNHAEFCDVAGGEDAEPLLEWLLKYPKGKIDLGGCTHLHSAVLQVLMAAGCTPHVPPRDEALALWITAALAPHHGGASRGKDHPDRR